VSTNGTELVRASGGAIVQRQEFGATELQVVKETAAAAVAAREKAAVEARYVMALRQPRNIEYARQQLLKACDNKSFASSSWYKIPNKGEGFTIRFAEEALRCFGNVYPETMTVYENEQIRMIRVTVTDLESNLSYSSEVIIQKAVERQNVKPGQVVLGERINSYGKKVFLVEATEDEVTVKQNALRSKALRTDGLRLIPSWLKEEAKQRIFETMSHEIKEDLDGAKRKMIDSFAELGVKVPDLEAYLAHSIERVTPKEVSDLKKIWVAVANNEASWAEVLESRQPSEEEKHGSKEAAQKVAEDKLKAAGVTVESKPADEQPAESEPEAPKGQTRGFSFGGKK